MESEYESYIKRESPELPVTFVKENGEREHAWLNYNNALVVLHDEPYEEYDHLIYLNPDMPNGKLIFFIHGEEEVVEKLSQTNFRQLICAYPSKEIEEEWFKRQCDDIQGL